MDKQECISQLENLKKHCMDWSPEPPWDKDVKALDMAIEILKETAQEVPVQEQLIKPLVNTKGLENFAKTLSQNLTNYGIPSKE